MSEGPQTRVKGGAKTIVRVFGHPVSANEVHGVAIGVSGFFLGLMYQTGASTVQGIAALTMLVLVGYAILGKPALHSLPKDAPEYQTTVGMKTIKTEPWWFLVSFTACFAAALAVAPSLGS